jgi:hypothetical protein
MDIDKILSGLITITVSSLISIKALKIVVRVNKNNMSISGTHNRIDVINIYNNQLIDDGGDYKLLWGFLFTLLMVAFPFHPLAFCYSLYIVALVCPLVACIACFLNLMQIGLPRFWDLLYLPTSATLAWVTIAGFPYISDAAPHGAYHHDVGALITSWSYGIKYLYDQKIPQRVLESISLCTGFCLLFLAHFWLGFSFLRWRKFDRALTHSCIFFLFGICGATMACGLMFALQRQNYQFIEGAFHAVIDPLIDLFS